MCGIAGYYGLDKKNRTLLETFNEVQAHRGPDGEGYYQDDLVGFAHARLAIIDRKHGAQPMSIEDGNLVVAYNGEIYNYHELRAELETAGRIFRTDSDTEVILHAYAEWGDDAFDKFNGMFAIALRDKKNDRLLLVRDHFGIKPLFYANIDTEKKPRILFASEIKPLLASGLVEKKPNDAVIYRYLQFRIHDDGEQTFFDGIYHLPAGEMLVIDKSGITKKPFTNLKNELRAAAKEDRAFTKTTVDEYHSRLTESVRLRLQSEVPVGTSLSGGLDSSAVAVIINKLLEDDKGDSAIKSVGAKQNTFSAIFPGSMNDEEKYVDAVLDKMQGHVQSHKIQPTADEFIVDLEDFIRTQEEPLISSGPYAQYQVMREATKDVTVLLDGQGADEMMAGYVPYYFVYLKQLRAQKNFSKLAYELARSSDVLFRLGRFRLKDKLTAKKKVFVGSLLNRDFKRQHQSERFTTTGDNLKERLIEDLFHNSLPSLLRYEDKNTMRFSLEGRVPFLDKDVVKFLFSLSDEAIIEAGWNKRILRESMKGLLPAMITERRNKIGFTTPEGEWFYHLKTRFYQIFLSEEFANRPYFDQTAVVEAFEGFIQGKNNASSFLFWRLLNVELWLREFFDEKKEAPKEVKPKTDYEPNEDKQLDIQVGDETFRRFPLHTDLISAKDDLDEKVVGYVKRFFRGVGNAPKSAQPVRGATWYFFISEKIVAITQGRSYFLWDIKPRWWARTLAHFVTKTPHGIGLGSPFTMELAIREVGLPKILYASIGGFVGKLVHKRGVFYNLVGENIRAIDGPTEYSAYPSNVSAKLAPKDPDKVAERLTTAIRELIPDEFKHTFGGVIVMDANDIGRNVLGKHAEGSKRYFEEMFGDNPLGQAHEQTPMAIVFKQK